MSKTLVCDTMPYKGKTGNMKRTAFLFLMMILCPCAFCATESLEDQVKYKQELVKELKEEIAQIDSEMLRCQSSKKKWIAATVVGGVGVVATGAAAIVQSVNANKKKEEKTNTQTQEKQE